MITQPDTSYNWSYLCLRPARPPTFYSLHLRCIISERGKIYCRAFRIHSRVERCIENKKYKRQWQHYCTIWRKSVMTFSLSKHYWPIDHWRSLCRLGSTIYLRRRSITGSWHPKIHPLGQWTPPTRVTRPTNQKSSKMQAMRKSKQKISGARYANNAIAMYA